MPLSIEQRDLLAIVDRRGREAEKIYQFDSSPAPVKALRLSQMVETVLALADALDGLDSDTQQALTLTRQATDAFQQAAQAHVNRLEG